MYSLRNSEKFREPIQMELSKILKIFCQHFAELVESTSNIKHFGKKDVPIYVFLFEVTQCERQRYTNV